jgi:glutathione S-transferase
MKLYYAAGSCALAVHIALEDAGARYEAIEIRFDRQEQRSPQHLARNPLGRVPVLETPHGMLTEVPAILGYVAATHPSAGLLPPGPFDLARAHSFCAFLSSSVHPEYAHFRRPERWAADDTCRRAISDKAIGTYADRFRMIESHWLAGPWVMGIRYTVADPYLYALARWLPLAGIPLAAYPRISEHARRMDERASVHRALTAEGVA